MAAELLAAWLLQKLAIPGCPALAAAMLLPLLQLCAQVGFSLVVRRSELVQTLFLSTPCRIRQQRTVRSSAPDL